jgi:xanthine dehydrogenase FAD-binding subunit
MVNGYIAESLEDALKIRKNFEVMPLAGGTDIMVKEHHQDILFIGHLKELKEITVQNNYLHLGAACTFSEIIENKLVPEYIKEILLGIGSPAIRNMGTIGGNICNASPAGDTLPLLYALNSYFIIKSLDEVRKTTIANFIAIPGKNNLKNDELLQEIIIPLNQFNIIYYKKVGTRKANSLSKASFIGFAQINNKAIEDIRIAFGAVSPTVVRDKNIEKILIGLNGKELENNLPKIKEMYANLIWPIDDQRSSKEYRKKVSLNLLAYFLLNKIYMSL